MNGACGSCGIVALPRDEFCAQCGTAVPGSLPPVDAVPRHRRRTSRRWFQRPLIVLPLVMLLLAGSLGGYLLLQASATVATIHQLSTPPPAIPVGVLGGSGTVQIDTDAAVRSVQADPRYAGYTGAETGNFDGVQQVAGGVSGGVAAAAGLQQNAPDEPLNILLMGVDARPGEAIDIEVRPDALAVLHLDPASGSCRLLAIPRDTRVELPGYGQSKINHALAVGGIPYQMQVVERFLGIELDHYGLIDFGGLEELVDAVGGVTIEIPETFTHMGVTFEAGTRTLDGEEALIYARYRGGPDGDFGRIHRQQQILRALIAELSGMNVARAANELLPAMREHTRTDLNPAELIDLATRYRGKCIADSAGMESLDGTTGTYHDPLLDLDLSYVIVDDAEVRDKVAWLFGE